MEVRGIRKESSYLELLKNRNFLLLWLGQAISSVGDWIIIVPLIQVVSHFSAQSSLAVGVLIMFKILPALLFGSIVGVFADRLSRKKTMVFCDLARAGLVLSLPFIRSLSQIYLVVFLMETLSLLFLPAKDASIPNLVGRKQIVKANSLSYITTQVMTIVGLLLGSTVVLIISKIVKIIPPAITDLAIQAPILKYFIPQLAGPHIVFIVDSLSFFTSAALIALIVLPMSVGKIRRINYAQIKDDLLDGLRFMGEHSQIRTMLITVSIAVLGGATIATVGVSYCVDVLKVGNEAYGFLLAGLAIGMLLGGFLTPFISRYVPKQVLFSLSFVVFGAGLLFFVFLPFFETAIIVSVIAGLAEGVVFVLGYSYLHETVVDKMRGRVFAVLESLLRVSLLVSLALSGGVADAIDRLGSFSIGVVSVHLNGARTTLFLGSLLVLAAGAYAYLTVHLNKRQVTKT